MREQILSKNLKVLIVCPSHAYSTIERRALADCEYLRDIGGSPTLYCVKDSTVDKEADQLSLPRIFSRGHKNKNILKLSNFFYLKKIINEGEYDLIHCYHLDSLWAVSFWLLSKPRIPLFLTFNRFIEKKVNGLVKGWLLKRVDKVLTFNKSTKDIALNGLEIPKHKIRVIGMGVETTYQYENKKEAERFISCFVSENSDLDNLRTILYSLGPLTKQVQDLGISLKLLVHSIKPIKDYYHYTEIAEKMNQLDLKSEVIFLPFESISQVIKRSDYFISTAFHEPFNDLEIQSLICRVPTIYPRTAARQNMLSEFTNISESYYFQDARELREAILNLIVNQDSYIESMNNHNDTLLAIHGIDIYTEKVHSEYEVSVKKRLRFESVQKK